MRTPKTVLLLPLLMTAVLSAQSLAPSALPPAGLSPAQVPQFVLLGFDDNPDTEPMTWFIDHTAKLHNPAGTGQAATFDGGLVRAIFLSNGKYWTDPALVAIHRRAVAEGHELGNHTQNHNNGSAFTVEQWRAEIATCEKTFTAAGVPAAGLGGFRTPFLAYNGATFAALAAEKQTYDSSVEEGVQPGQDGTNFLWPYTLDHGSPGNAHKFPADAPQRIAATPGLWEIPIHVFIVPLDQDCERYGVPPGLREKIRNYIKTNRGWDWPATDGKITGLDWNSFEMAGLNGPEYLAILKNTLDLRLAGNRTPFMVGGHTALYPVAKPDRRQAMEEFIAYALTKPEVRFVTGHQLLQWLKKPAPLVGK